MGQKLLGGTRNSGRVGRGERHSLECAQAAQKWEKTVWGSGRAGRGERHSLGCAQSAQKWEKSSLGVTRSSEELGGMKAEPWDVLRLPRDGRKAGWEMWKSRGKLCVH